MNGTTIVTGLWDIKREELSEGWSRSYTHYLEKLAELLKIDNIVLATGGGIIINEENRKLIKEKGTIIYLRATVNDLLHRTRHDKNRPLLQTTDPQAKLTDLYDQRDPIYCEAAHIVVESGSLSVHQMVKYLTQRLDNLALE